MSKDISQPPAPQASSMIPKVMVELSKIATNPKQSKAFLVIFVLASGFLGYHFLNQTKKVDPLEAPKSDVADPKKVYKPLQDESYTQELAPPELTDASELKEIKKDKDPVENLNLPTLPVVADTVEEKKPTTPENVIAPPPQLIDNTNASEILPTNSSAALPEISNNSEEEASQKKRNQSAIMLLSGSTSSSTTPKKEEEAAYSLRPNLDRTLGRGKLIDAAIETAINTDFLGDVRAIITRDVYAESGKTILIPKGSRVHGNSTATTVGAYARINITWDRIDLSTGYSITINSKGVDGLGRVGVQGRLDGKVKEQIGGVLLSSAVSIIMAGAMDRLTKTSSSLVYEAPAIIYAVNTVYNDATIADPATKMTRMCDSAKSAVTNTSSTLYTQITGACAASAGGTVMDLYNKLIQYASAAGATTSSSSSSSGTSSSSTQTQTAITDAMSDFKDTMTKIVEQNEQKPTITLDQGTKIKIYVNKDYTFPVQAIRGTKLLQ
ncbi:MAG: TrbI/VirB10 family protein [Alphaproteobacteria bacterium]|nr:TrbI/VirB10 family protein [Alphaproteobacteria bacterium]